MPPAENTIDSLPSGEDSSSAAETSVCEPSKSTTEETTSTYLPSKSDEFGTPDALYNILDNEFIFGLDAAATDTNTKCPLRWFTKEDDALTKDWVAAVTWGSRIDGAAFCNPPYSRGNLYKFTAKAYEESQRGIIVVMVVPACTDTAWFHDNVLGKAEIRFVKGRVTFKGGKTSARFPSLILVYRPGMPMQQLYK